MAVDDPLRLLHELQVHQVELEMQNFELRRAREDVETHLRKYTDLYDFAPAGHFTLDPNGRIRSVNLTGAELLGIERSQLINRPFTEFIGVDDRSVFATFLTTIFAAPVKQTCEIPLQPSDKAPLVVQIQAISNPSATECRIALLDITELQRARQNLLKTQKLESLGVLAGGIAHDFNNILTAILGNISLARIQQHKPAVLSELLEEAEQATLRAKDLTKQLLTFAKGGEPVKRVFSLARLLDEATNLATRGSSASSRMVVPDDLWPIKADEGQISQVIHNLVINAAQAMPAGGTVTVTAENVTSQDPESRFVRFSIADTGSGIPKALQQKIFEPYYTTKPTGSGLGLAVCHSIIKNHDGDINFESTVGKGTTFTINLPASDQAELEQTATIQQVTPGSGRILVMDDDAMVRSIAELMLEELGYQPECTQTGSETVELYRQRMAEGTPFAAVIMDLTLPGETGGQNVLAKLRQLDPRVKAVVCSGYATDPVLANYRDYGFQDVLCKPYRMEELSLILKKLFHPEG